MNFLQWKNNCLVGKGSFGTVYQNNDPTLVTKIFSSFGDGVYELGILHILNNENSLVINERNKCQLDYHSYSYYNNGKFYCYDKHSGYNILNPDQNLLAAQNSFIINLPKFTYNLSSLCDQIKHLHTQVDYRSIIYQIFRSYYNIYNSFLVHGDIKFGNMLIKKNINKLGFVEYNPVICDFNISFRHFGSNLSGQYNLEDLDYIQTVNYRSPELILGCTDFDYRIDLWSLGVLIFKMASKIEFFNATDKEQQICCLCRFFGLKTVKDFCDQKGYPVKLPQRNYRAQKNKLLGNIENTHLRDLIDKLLILDPAERLNLEGVFSHMYLSIPVKVSGFQFKRRDLKIYLDHYFSSRLVDVAKFRSGDVSCSFDRFGTFKMIANKFFFTRSLSMVIFSRAVYLFDYLVSHQQITGTLKNFLAIIRIYGIRHFDSSDRATLINFLSLSDREKFTEHYYNLLIKVRFHIESPCHLDYLNLFSNCDNNTELPHLRIYSSFWDRYIETVSNYDHYLIGGYELMTNLLSHSKTQQMVPDPVKSSAVFMTPDNHSIIVS